MVRKARIEDFEKIVRLHINCRNIKCKRYPILRKERLCAV